MHVTTDPVSGPEAAGSIVNHSTIVQAGLVVDAVGRKGGRIVAAGRAILPRLVPTKPTMFHIFFIGNPYGAAIQVSAPPTSLP